MHWKVLSPTIVFRQENFLSPIFHQDSINSIKLHEPTFFCHDFPSTFRQFPSSFAFLSIFHQSSIKIPSRYDSPSIFHQFQSTFSINHKFCWWKWWIFFQQAYIDGNFAIGFEFSIKFHQYSIRIDGIHQFPSISIKKLMEIIETDGNSREGRDLFSSTQKFRLARFNYRCNYYVAQVNMVTWPAGDDDITWCLNLDHLSICDLRHYKREHNLIWLK